MYDPVGEEMPFGSHWHPVVGTGAGIPVVEVHLIMVHVKCVN